MTSLRACLPMLWLACLPVLADARAEVWSDEHALWQGAAWWSPQKVRPWVQLGEIAYRQGDLAQSAEYFDHAITVYDTAKRPAFEQVGCRIAVHNLGVVLMQQGLFREAAERSADRCVGPRS